MQKKKKCSVIVGRREKKKKKKKAGVESVWDRTWKKENWVAEYLGKRRLTTKSRDGFTYPPPYRRLAYLSTDINKG